MKREILLFALILTACGTSPEPDYYDLTAMDGPLNPDLVLAVKIQRPTLPDYLDRPDIVREESAYQYTIDDMHRWAEPLDRMFERVLTEDLRQRLPNSKVLAESEFDTNDLRYKVETNIETFNAVNHNEARLKGQLSINDKSGAPVIKSQQVEFNAPVGASADTIAAGLSKLAADYANCIVIDLQQRIPQAQ